MNHNLPQYGRSESAGGGASPVAPSANESSVQGRVERVLEAIRPAIQADGGDIELLEVTGAGVVRIRLHGACVGCPSSMMTLKVGIEQNLRTYVPEVTGIEAVE